MLDIIGVDAHPLRHRRYALGSEVDHFLVGNLGFDYRGGYLEEDERVTEVIFTYLVRPP